VTFTSLTTGVCTVNGTTVAGVTAGTCTIAADQSGNANYNAAQRVTRDIAVTCSGYGVYNNITGSARYFKVTGGSCQNVSYGGAITTNGLHAGDTVTRYSSGLGCLFNAGQGDITYTDAATADINRNCQVNYNSGDTAGDK
jgi:hypothetical protein